MTADNQTHCASANDAAVANTSQSSVALVDGGKAQFSLHVIPTQDAEAMFPAISELIVHLRNCIGAEPAWFGGADSEHLPAQLCLHLAPESDLGREGYEIDGDAARQAVTLRAASPTGLSHAVHHFLEAAFGVRWLWPGASGTVTPRAVNVAWPAGCRREQPAWAWRRLWFGGAFYQADDATLAEMKFGGVTPETLEQLHLWQRRTRLGGLNIADGHRWGQICSPLQYAQSHPEYFALVGGNRDTHYLDGKHGNQPCTSNVEVVKLTADHLIAQFTARPELDGFSLAVNDGHGFCECPECCAIDDWAKSQSHDTSDLDRTVADDIPFAHRGKSLTDRMLLFANHVAERVEAVHPQKLLLVLIYSVYRNPPQRVKLHANVIAQFATATWGHVEPAIHEQELKTLSNLGAFAQRRGIYDYFINGVNGSLPRGFARLLPQCLRDYRDAGCAYFASQASLDFGTNGFAYYLATRCLWNADADYDDVLDDYCRSGFGPAASHIRSYLNAFVERWHEPLDRALRNGAVEHLAAALYDPAWLLARRGEITAAQQAATDPPTARRVAFVATGFAFLELFCRAARACLAMVQAGAPVPKERDWQPRLIAWTHRAEVKGLIDAAITARRELLAWIEQHANSFCVAPMWAQYQRLGNRGLLGGWLNVIENGH